METPHAGGEDEAGSARKCGAIHVRLPCCEPSGRSCAALSRNGAAAQGTPTEDSGGGLAELGGEGSKSKPLFSNFALGVPSTQAGGEVDEEGGRTARRLSKLVSGGPSALELEEAREPLTAPGTLTEEPSSPNVLRKCGAIHVKFGCKGGSAANGGRAGKEGKERTVQGETTKGEFARGGGSSKAGGRGRDAFERVPAPSLGSKLLASGGPEGSRTR